MFFIGSLNSAHCLTGAELSTEDRKMTEDCALLYKHSIPSSQVQKVMGS